jgi:flagellar motor switch protein FliM
MSKILSQDEIDALLSAISTGEVEDYSNVGEQKKVKIYDFRRPDKFSKDQIRTLQMMHEIFARTLKSTLLSNLHLPIDFFIGSVDQLTYEEFIRSIPNPTTFAVISMNPFEGNALLEIDPGITETIIEFLLGGENINLDKFNSREQMTELEMSLMENVIINMSGKLIDIWKDVVDLRPRLLSIETNPLFYSIPSNEPVILITIETRIKNIEGMINLCYPFSMLEPILNKLTSSYKHMSLRETKDISKDDLKELPVKVSFGYKEVFLPLEKVENLKTGDFISIGDNTIYGRNTIGDILWKQRA